MNQPPQLVNPNEIERFLAMLVLPDSVFEIRLLDVSLNSTSQPHTVSGYFERIQIAEAASQIASLLSQKNTTAAGCYVTLNPLPKDLLARAKNRLKRVKSGELTRDSEVLSRSWLLIDLDPTRPSGISSTDEEHDLALQRAHQIRKDLQGLGFPEPYLADSGNGAHLGYQLDLPNTSESTELVKQVLEALDFRYGDAFVSVDRSVFNAARITKICGTMSRKGDSTAERPHRLAHLLDAPSEWEPVPAELLNLVTAWLPDLVSQVIAGRHDEILPKILSQEVLAAQGPNEWRGGKLWRVECPWRPEDGRTGYIVEHPGGAISAGCWHKSCPGSNTTGNHWPELRRMFIPDPERQRDQASDKPKLTDISQIPSVWTYDAQLDWLVEGMIARGSVNLLCAESGTGKTWFAYFLAGRVAHGVPALGCAVSQIPVLYLDGENPIFEAKRRLSGNGIHETDNLKVWGGWVDPSPEGPLNPLVIKFATEQRGLIIYDSLVEFHPGSEQSATETRAFMRQFRSLANLGATVIVLHHSGKGETSKLYRGSSDIKASVDMAYFLKKETEASSKALGRLQLECFKCRLAPGKDFDMEFRMNEGFVGSDAPLTSRIRTTAEAIEEILEEFGELNQRSILDKLVARDFTRRQILNSLKNGPWQIRRGSTRNEILYGLPGDEDQCAFDEEI